MASSITRTKTIRLPNDVADWIEGINIRQVLTDMYENRGKEVELRGMCDFYGITYDSLISGVLEKVDNGEITIEDGKIVLNGNG